MADVLLCASLKESGPQPEWKRIINKSSSSINVSKQIFEMRKSSNTSALIKHQSLIESLRRAKTDKERQVILANAPNNFLSLIAQVIRRIVSGSLQLSNRQRNRLKAYRKPLIHIARFRQPSKVRHLVRKQKGGILPLIPILAGLAPLIAKGATVGLATAAAGALGRKLFSSGNETPAGTVPQTGAGTRRSVGKHYYYW